MGHYNPGSGAHAVEQAIVGVRLSEPAEHARYKQATDLALDVARDLPGRMVLDGMALAFGRQTISYGYTAPSQIEPGYLFQRVAPDGSTQHELTIERGAVTYRTNAYVRWEDVTKILLEVLCPVASALTAGTVERLSVVEFRCIDRFNCEYDQPPALAGLVRADSPLVPRDLHEKTEMLHFHSGWFSDQTQVGRYLTNLNVDVTDVSEGQRTATLLQVVSAQSMEGGQMFNVAEDFDRCLLTIFDELHRRDKRLLADVLTDEMQKAIGLEGKTGIPAR